MDRCGPRARTLINVLAASLASVVVLLSATSAGADPPCVVVDTIVIRATGLSGAPDSRVGILDRIAAVLHVTTRESTIRQAFPPHAGDCYDAARIAQGERALWTLGVFRAVATDTVRLPGTARLALVVSTTDGWSVRPVADYARTGTRSSWEAGFLEQNLFGTATRFFASYRTTPDRRGVTLHFTDPSFMAPGGLLFLRHSAQVDGRRTAWRVGAPFRESSSRYSVVLDGVSIAEPAIVIPPNPLAPRTRALRFRLTVARALRASPNGYLRLWLGMRWRREAWSPSREAPFVRATVGAAGVGFEVARVRLRAMRGVNTQGREEWIDVSHMARVGFWSAPSAWGSSATRPAIGFELAARSALSWARGYAVLRAGASGAWADGRADSGRVRVQLTLAMQPTPGQTLVVHADGRTMLGKYPPGVFDLWLEGRGPRLFPPHGFVGTRVWWLVLEHRIPVGRAVGGMLGLGVAPFVEYCRVDGTRGRAAGANAGLALRIAPLRMASGDITELALGYRLAPGERPRATVGVRRAITF